jgi:hypothetical protein
MSAQNESRTFAQREKELQFKLTHAYPLPSDYPEEFKEICGLGPLKQKVEEQGIESLQLMLGEIVYLYRRRLRDREYFARIESCIRSAEASSESLTQIIKTLCKLDIGHIKGLMFAASEIDPPHFDNQDFMGFVRRFDEFKSMMEVFCLALMAATGTSAEPRGKGAPGLPYTAAAFELAEAWEELTGKPVVSPKGKVRGKKSELESPQSSTQFVRLGLKMIDPKSTLPNAITSIRNVLALKKSIEPIMLRYSGRNRPFRSFLMSGRTSLSSTKRCRTTGKR